MNPKTSPTAPFAAALAAAAFTVAGASPAAATLVADGPPVETIDAVSINGGLGGLVTEFPGGAFDATWDPAGQVLNLSGDANIAVVQNANRIYTFTAAMAFEPIGLFPVQITPQVTADFKGVVGGGTFAAPYLRATTLVSVYERGSFDPADLDRVEPDYSGLGLEVVAGGNAVDRTGNGLIFGEDFTMPSFVLAPGVEYVVLALVELRINANDLDVGEPVSVVTLEAGGVSGFGGLSVDFNAVFVPEPASLALLTLGGLSLLRRRDAGR